MVQEYIEIRGARENNLKDVSLRLPKRKIIMFTGVSGSGKSSVVFDTIANEAQRLLFENFSMFVRNFLPRYPQPDADALENLSMAVIVDQKRLGGGSHSTVGTATDIAPLLRLLFARLGQPRVGNANALSFNDPQGMCLECNGLGRAIGVDLAALLDATKSLSEGAVIAPGFTRGECDIYALFATFSDPDVMEFYGDLPHQTLEDSRELIRRQHHWYAQREGIRWGITRQGAAEVIGSCGFHNFDAGCHRAETGYELRQAYWRQGIMREAMGAILTCAFDAMDLHRVEAVVDDVNERSKSFLRALGFTHEGTLRQRFSFRDRFLDEHYFGLLKAEWERNGEVNTALREV